MGPQQLGEAIKVEMAVRTVDGAHLGTVAEVWPDPSGEHLSDGDSTPESGAEATDPELFTFSEGMPGEADSYFRVRTPDGRDLYITFSAVVRADGDAIELAIDAASLAGMQCDVIPDFLNTPTKRDSQGGPHVA